MKHTISDLSKFKKDLLRQAIENVELEIQAFESQAQKTIDSASDTADPYSNFSKKELAEQKARQVLSDLKTPLFDLKKLLQISFPNQTDDVVREYSLFDLTISDSERTKTMTFFVLPLQTLGKVKPNVKMDGKSVVLTTQSHKWFGRRLNEKEYHKSVELWEEPHMGHVIMTGEFSKAVNIWISWIYK
jgi:hypothetical protein